MSRVSRGVTNDQAGIRDHSSVPRRSSPWSRWRVRIAALAALCAGLIATGYASWLTFQRENSRIHSQFSAQAAGLVRSLEGNLGEGGKFLEFLQAFFAASENVYRSEFALFCGSQLKEVPGVKLVAWAPQVYPDQEQAFLDFARQRGVVLATLWEMGEGGKPSLVQTRPVHYPILFIEPSATLGDAAGFDLASVPGWEETLAQTVQSAEINSFILDAVPVLNVATAEQPSPAGQSEPSAARADQRTDPAVTGEIVGETADELGAVDDDGDLLLNPAARLPMQVEGDSPSSHRGRSWLVLTCPLFLGGIVPDQPWERATQCSGVLLCVMDLSQLFAPVQEWSTTRAVAVRVVDQTAGGNVLFASGSGNILSTLGGENGTALGRRFGREQERWTAKGQIRLWGRTWEISMRPSVAYITARRSDAHWWLLGSGSLCAFLLALYVNVVGGRSLRVQQLVAERTQELLDVNRRLEETNRRLEEEICRREQVEKELRDSEALYSSLVENLPVHVIRKDCQGHFTFGNSSFCRLVNRSREEIIGKTDFDFYPPDLASKYRRDDRRVIETGELFEDIEEYEKNGDKRHMQVLKSPLRDSFGNIVGVQIVFWDVTEKVAVQRALERAKQAAEEANRAKSDFLANMSHEIRTPMNAILGMAQLLEETPLNTEQKEYLRIIREAGDNLLALINTILDFSKIEAGRVELDSVEFGLRELVGDTMKALAVRAHRKQLELACRVAPDVPEDLVGDPVRLRQLLINLVDNAIKFTEHGEVVVNVDCLECGRSDALLKFSVRDTGIGIPPEKQKSIFAAFEQVDKSTTRKYGGTGLGLSICKRLVEMMGGTIELESQAGRGSTFWFTARFRLAQPIHAKVTPSELQRYAGQRMLVVDDNATNRRILAEMLNNWGLNSAQAASGPEALQLLTDDKGELQYAVVITDMRMPGMDGPNLIKQLRRRFGADQLPIIVLSSEDRPADNEFFRRFEVAGVLRKPVKQSELYNMLAEILGLAYHPETRTPVRTTFPKLPPLKVLLVEDSPFNQQVAIGLLEKHGHRVTAVFNGKEALDAIAREDFDLVLMDVQMPEMDGYTATAEIRAREARLGLPRTPIVAMTAHALKGDREQALAAGMDGYVAKPIVVSEFFQTIAEVLRRIRGISLDEGEPQSATGLAAQDQASHEAGKDGTFAEQSTVEAAADGNDIQPATPGQTSIEEVAATNAPAGHTPPGQTPAKQASAARPSAGQTPAGQTPADLGRVETAPLGQSPIEQTSADQVCAQQSATEQSPADKAPPENVASRGVSKNEPGEESPAVPQERVSKGDLKPTQESTQAVVDWDHALRAVCGDQELLRVLVDTFLDEMPQRVQTLQKSLAEGDTVTAKRAAHTLGGSCRHFGAQDAADIAYQMEQLLGQEKLAESQSLLDPLQKSLNNIIRALEQKRQEWKAG